MHINVLTDIHGKLHGLTHDDNVAKEWLEVQNKDWQQSGNIGPTYRVASWPISTTLEEALGAAKQQKAETDATAFLESFNKLSPETSRIVANKIQSV